MRLSESARQFNRDKFTDFNMMHYAPWVHQQIIMDNQRYYPQYMDELSHFQHRSDTVEDDSEQTGDEMHDTMTSATSGERSPSADLFRLEFAATQWSKLVSNAEGLFNKLIVSNILPHNEQDQIEQWLCLKQEYEECITSDDTISFQGYGENARRSLEIIEEVTETDEKTDESGNRVDYQDRSETCSETESEISEEDDEDDQSDTNSENPDFVDRLDDCLEEFHIATLDTSVSTQDNVSKSNIPLISSTPELSNNNDSIPAMKPPPARNPKMRRNSMLPGSEMCNGLLAFNENFKLAQKQNNHTDSDNSFSPSRFSESLQNIDNSFSPSKFSDSLQNNDNSYSPLKFSESVQNSDTELRNINNEIAIIAQKPPNLYLDVLRNSDSPGPIKELKALTKNNKVKQRNILKIQSDLKGAHKRIEELQSTIETKEHSIAEMMRNSDTRASAKHKFQVKKTKLEEEYLRTTTKLAYAENAFTNEDGERSTCKKEIEMCKNMAFYYEKKLMDIEMIKQIAGDSARKVRELELSLSTSKQQMEELTLKLKQEECLKKQLEDEVAEDQKKIRELEDKYNLTASKLKEIQSESEDERAKSRSEGTEKKNNLLDVSDRISHLDHVLKEKSMDLERAAGIDEKDALRYEIRHLRRTRDCLVDEKCDLGEKWQKERQLSIVEERKLLECGETIEAIDAMIEHKNEMICGRKSFDEDQKNRDNGKYLKNLDKLTDGEIKKLFHTYFTKVIDLKQNLQSLDIANAKLEQENDLLKFEYRKLCHILEQERIQAERSSILLQQKLEKRECVMLKHCAENSSSSSHEKMDNNSEIERYRQKNQILKQRLQDAEAQIHRKPSTTKITREKNKLIIQKCKDSGKRRK